MRDLRRGMLGLGMILCAVAAVVSVLPYMSLASYGFPTLDDLVFFVTYKDQGMAHTMQWYYERVTGRLSTLVVHALLIDLTLAIRSDPWLWNAISAVFYHLTLVASLAVFIRVVLPTLRLAFVVTWAAIPVAATHAMAVNGFGIGVVSQPLWPFVLALYTLAFTAFPVFMAALILWLEPRGTGWVRAVIVAAVLFFLTVSHEVAAPAMGVLLIGLLLIVVRFTGFREAVAMFWPLSKIRLGFSFRPERSNRAFVGGLVLFGLVVLAGASVHLYSPSVDARADYWPATMSVAEAVIAAWPIFEKVLLTICGFSPPLFVAFFAMSFVFGFAAPVRESLRGINRRILLLPILAFLVVAYVSSVASLVMLGNFIPRVIHYVLLFAGFGVGGLGLYLGGLVGGALLAPEQRTERHASRGPATAVPLVAAVAMIGMIYTDPTFITATKQATGSGLFFAGNLLTRIEQLAGGSVRVVRIEALERPPTLVLPVIHGPNTEQMFQRLVAAAYGQKKVVFLPCGESDDLYWCHYRFNPRDGREPELMPEGQYEGPGMRRQRERQAQTR